MGLYETLISRTSVRNFSSAPISKEIITKIINAGHHAATARNIQPWLFVVVTDAVRRKAIKDMCPNNGPYIEFAPVCVCVFCENVTYYLEDGSAATQNILNAAHSFGLGAVWVVGDKKDYADKIREYLKVPNNYKLVSLIPIGYPSEKVKPTEKKPLEEKLFWEEYSK